MAFNILIVDDSPTVRAVVKKCIAMSELPIGMLIEAENGAEALELLESNWVDLVLADINMPVMNGYEMIEKMKSSGLLKSIPVLVVSTEGSKQRVGELSEMGIAGYLRKPFTPESLREAIERALGTAKSESCDTRNTHG